jgi:integrase
MSARRPATGHVRTIERKGGPVLYAKLKLPDGREPQRRLGKLWTKRSRPPAGYLTRPQAEARLEAILAGDDPLVNLTPSRVTFKAACDEHVRYLEHDRQRKRSTIGDAQSTIKVHLLPAFGESTPVEDITTVDVDAFRDKLLAGKLSHRTAQKILILLHGVLKRAKRKGWVQTNVAEDAEKVTVRHSDEFNVLSVEQVQAVARAAASELLSALFVVAAFTGLRQGELLALRWRHVDFTDRIVHVVKNFVRGEEDTPKSHRVRSVPLSDQAFVALDALSRREHFTGPEDLVLGSEVGGHLLDDVVRDAFYEALDDAGLGELRAKDDPIVFHDLRHTFGTLAIRVAPVTDVQHWMGHADIQTTMRYVHYVPQHDNAVKLTAAFTAGSVPPDEPAAWPARAARTDDVGDERIARGSRIAEAEAFKRAASGAFAFRPRR